MGVSPGSWRRRNDLITSGTSHFLYLYFFLLLSKWYNWDMLPKRKMKKVKKKEAKITKNNIRQQQQHNKKSGCWAFAKNFMSTLFRMVIGSTKKEKGKKRVISWVGWKWPANQNWCPRFLEEKSNKKGFGRQLSKDNIQRKPFSPTLAFMQWM